MRRLPRTGSFVVFLCSNEGAKCSGRYFLRWSVVRRRGRLRHVRSRPTSYPRLGLQMWLRAGESLCLGADCESSALDQAARSLSAQTAMTAKDGNVGDETFQGRAPTTCAPGYH